jgi:hypothetical protein
MEDPEECKARAREDIPKGLLVIEYEGIELALIGLKP